MKAYLSVHENIYDGIVNSAALCKINWYGSSDRVHIKAGVHDDSYGHCSIRQPGDQEGQHHHHHHACNLHLHTMPASCIAYLQLGDLGYELEHFIMTSVQAAKAHAQYPCCSPDGGSIRAANRTT